METIIFKLICMGIMLFMLICTAHLYDVFEKIPKSNEKDRGSVAIGILAEVVVIIRLITQIIIK